MALITWTEVLKKLVNAGWSPRRRADVAVGYDLGYKAALDYLGTTTTAAAMNRRWHEEYIEAIDLAGAAVRRIRAEARPPAGGRRVRPPEAADDKALRALVAPDDAPDDDDTAGYINAAIRR